MKTHTAEIIVGLAVLAIVVGIVGLVFTHQPPCVPQTAQVVTVRAAMRGPAATEPRAVVQQAMIRNYWRDMGMDNAELRHNLEEQLQGAALEYYKSLDEEGFNKLGFESFNVLGDAVFEAQSLIIK